MSEARERLAATVRASWLYQRQDADGDWSTVQASPEEIAAALLPVVQALVAEGQAEALEAAAGEVRDRFGWAGGYGKTLRDRAAALRATTSGEGT